jgi:hypothetical protein
VLAVVEDEGSSEAARFQLSGGELGRMGSKLGCSEGSSSVRRRSRGVARGSEWGSAGGSAVVDEHVDDDVAVVLGRSRCVTGSSGTGWGELRDRGGVVVAAPFPRSC